MNSEPGGQCDRSHKRPKAVAADRRAGTCPGAPVKV